MQRRAVFILVAITPALLITSCKSSSKSKVTTLPLKVSAIATTPATPAPASSAPVTATPLPPLPPATSAPASPSATPTPTPTPTASPSGSLAPTDLDPCQLVTQDEASTLANATFGPGREVASPGHPKGCIYGSQTKNVLDVIVAQSPDAKTAQAGFAQVQAQAQSQFEAELPPGVHVNLNSANAEGIGDKATTVTFSNSGNGATISFSGIYVLKGATFFTIGDLVTGASPATITALKDQAQVVLGRI
jgi:hypothetical protein